MDTDTAFAGPDHVAVPGAWAAVLPAGAHRDALPGVAATSLAHLGDAEGETRHLLAGGDALVPLVAQGAARLVGGDRVDFLHGLVSHDVRGLAVGEARLALLLDHRGRPRAGLTVIRRESDLYLSVDDGAGAAVRQVLEEHVIFDDVRVQDLDTRIAVLVVSGATALARLAEMLATSPASLTETGRVGQHGWRGSDVLVHTRPRGLATSVDVHVLDARLPELTAALATSGARLVGERALAAARVAAGLPAATFEGAEALPQESGLEARVSYRKGCYLGQEIMARVEARGTVRRALARLVLDVAPTASGALDVCNAAGRGVGRVGTVARDATGGWRALAVLRRDVGEGAALAALGAHARVEAWLG